MKHWDAYIKGTLCGRVLAINEEEALKVAKRDFPTKYKIEVFERRNSNEMD
jgi:hypothetical protein